MIAEAWTNFPVVPFGAPVLGVALLLVAPLAVADGIVAVGAANGSAPRVQVFKAESREPKFDFLAYHPGFHGGVNVGVGDVDGDGAPDVVTAAGAGGAPHIRVYDGRSGRPLSGPSADFMAFPRDFRGGVSVAVGDVDGDGKADIITGIVSGGPRVRVFSGADGSVLADFLAFEKGFRGGVRVAAGDFRHRMAVDLIVATGAGSAPRVRVFSGDGKTLLADRTVFPAGYRAGVSVGSGDLDHDGTVDLVVAASSGGKGRVKVFSGLDDKVLADLDVGDAGGDRQIRVDAVDADGDHFDDLMVGLGTSRAPIVRVHRGRTWEPIRTYPAFGSGFAGTPSVAGSVEHGRGTNYALAAPVTHEIPVIRRLYQYLPIDASHPKGQYVPVLGGTIPPNKHIYVVTHGWAPGYRAWVNQYIDTHVLKWWETAGYNDTSFGPPDPDTGPASAWMFDDYAQDGIPISPVGGLAQQLTVADPDAVVLAYSWLDDSATTAVFDGMIPEQAYLSEALTNVNGMRLAAALLKALGPNYAGPIHLLGHSHGSKVATLAALALYQSPNVTTRAQQLTIFDSPESEPPDELSATNFLWHYFQQLPVGQTPASSFFVDNYFSAFGIEYGQMEIDSQRPLGGIVDTQLYAYPFSLSYLDDPGAWHSYPPAWYAQANVTPCNDGSANGGLAWSPLLGNTPDGMANEWEQSWTALDLKAARQACLVQPFFTLPPSVSYDDLVITDSDAKQPLPVSSISLGLGARQESTFDGSYQKNLGWSGISFDYTFSGPDRGILQIQINDYLAYYVDSAYVPAGSTQHVTMNIGYPSSNQGLAITLLPPPGVLSTAQVTLSNFKQFKVSLLDEGSASAHQASRRVIAGEDPQGKR